MGLTWYNRSRQFDNGIVWARSVTFGWGLWFSHAFPWIWVLSPNGQVPRWVERRAYRKAGQKAATRASMGPRR